MADPYPAPRSSLRGPEVALMPSAGRFVSRVAGAAFSFGAGAADGAAGVEAEGAEGLRSMF